MCFSFNFLFLCPRVRSTTGRWRDGEVARVRDYARAVWGVHGWVATVDRQGVGLSVCPGGPGVGSWGVTVGTRACATARG